MYTSLIFRWWKVSLVLNLAPVDSVQATITDQIGRVGPYSQVGNNGGEKLINGIGQCRPPSDIFQSGITASSPIPLPATLPRCHSAEQDSYYR